MSNNAPEPWVTLKELAAHLKTSERYLKYRISEGMPSVLIGGRRKFKVSEAEGWLEAEGYMTRGGSSNV